MNEQHCACPHCSCRVDSSEWSRDGKSYCCQACQDGHPAGEVPCHNPGCDCGERMARARERTP